ncbi:hypothetical protein GN316_18190 [Xylophilus sp. Kf1]|nr:hypothetical protein [Xylophilus sp. Kf1]
MMKTTAVRAFGVCGSTGAVRMPNRCRCGPKRTGVSRTRLRPPSASTRKLSGTGSAVAASAAAASAASVDGGWRAWSHAPISDRAASGTSAS